MTRAERHDRETYRAERGRRPVHDGEIQMAVAFFLASLVGMAAMAMVMEAFK